jgi:fructose-1,6-bisphosphatase/inositol monophosphatase family enzyme
LESIVKFDLAEITRAAVRSIKEVQVLLQRCVDQDPSALSQLIQPQSGKPLLGVDLLAEMMMGIYLRRRLGDQRLLVIGEERLKADPVLDLTDEKRLVALVDVVDGTDLMVRGLSNWCSAIVFYYPPTQRIVAAFVGLPEDCIYYATEQQDSLVLKQRFHGEPKVVHVAGPSKVRDLHEASIGFYGQKFSNLASITEHASFMSALRTASTVTGSELRVYNLGGNPMMMRLIEGPRQIDAIVELKGQKPHDVVPGAYIAQKAGAVLRDLEGKPVDLHKSLLRPGDPKSQMRYVLTGTPELSEALLRHLKPKQPLVGDKRAGGRRVRDRRTNITW